MLLFGVPSCSLTRSLFIFLCVVCLIGRGVMCMASRHHHHHHPSSPPSPPPPSSHHHRHRHHLLHILLSHRQTHHHGHPHTVRLHKPAIIVDTVIAFITSWLTVTNTIITIAANTWVMNILASSAVCRSHDWHGHYHYSTNNPKPLNSKP